MHGHDTVAQIYFSYLISLILYVDCFFCFLVTSFQEWTKAGFFYSYFCIFPFYIHNNITRISVFSLSHKITGTPPGNQLFSCHVVRFIYDLSEL